MIVTLSPKLSIVLTVKCAAGQGDRVVAERVVAAAVEQNVGSAAGQGNDRRVVGGDGVVVRVLGRDRDAECRSPRLRDSRADRVMSNGSRGVTLKELLVTDKAGLLTFAVRVLLPVWLMLKPLKVARPDPDAVDCAPPPVSVPPPIKAHRNEQPGHRVRNWSVVFTVTAGERVAPAVTDEGGPRTNRMAVVVPVTSVSVPKLLPLERWSRL